MEAVRRADAQQHLLACLIGTYLLRVAANASGFYIALIVADLASGGAGVGARDVGLLAAAFYAAELLGAPVFGSLADRLGYRPFFLLGPLLGGAGLLLMPVALSRSSPAFVALLGLLLLIRVLEGLSTASSVPSALGFLAAATEALPSLRARVMGLFEAATLLGMFSGAPLAGLLWRVGGEANGRFWAVALVYLAAMLSFARVGAAPARAGGAAARPGGGGLRHARLWTFVPAWLAVNAMLGAWGSQIVYQLARPDDPGQLLVGGFSSEQIGALMGGFGAVFTVGAVGWSLLLPRVGKLRVMRLATVGAVATDTTLFWINHAAPDGSTLAASVGLLTLLVLLMSGFTPAALTHLADLSGQETARRGTLMGLYSVLLGLGQLVGGLLGGLFAGGLGPAAQTVGATGALEQGLGVDGLVLLSLLLAGVLAGAVACMRDDQPTPAR